MKQPTFTHLAKFQFTASSTIPAVGRITSKTNSKHNWKFNAGNPTLRSLANITQATKPFAARTQARRKILFATLVESTEGATSIDDNGFCLFTGLLSIRSSTPKPNRQSHDSWNRKPKVWQGCNQSSYRKAITASSILIQAPRALKASNRVKAHEISSLLRTSLVSPVIGYYPRQ